MNWKLNRLKTKIQGYNDAYRKGTPLVIDSIYDTLLEQIETDLSVEEYTEFRSTLFETTGKVKHDFVIGSLRKTKAEDDSFTTWFNKHQTSVLVAEKLDGVSIVLHFVDGILFKAVTRGDSEYGEDQTEKLKLIVPDLKVPFTGQLRGEVLLTRTSLANINAGIRLHNSPRGNPDQKNLKTEYKNPRNAVSGIIGKIDFDPDIVKQLSVRIYQMLGTRNNKAHQYKMLNDFGLDIPKLKVFNSNCTKENLVSLYEEWTESSDYDIDGVVVYDLTCVDENQKLPNNTVAFKVNDQVASSPYKGIEWNFSKNGLYKPVILIEPIELGGATIQRVTGHNWRNVMDLGISQGSILTIEKAGDIIPKIINVVTADSVVEAPTECVHCGTKLETTDVELYCPNKSCDGLGVKKVASFLKSCGVKGFTETTLTKFNIGSIEDLLKFTPNERKKNETKLILGLDDFVFNKPVEELVIHLPYTNFGTTLVKNVLKAFNNNVSAIREYRDMDVHVVVEKVSDERLNVFIEQLIGLYSWIIEITSDPRWNPNAVVIEDVKASTKFEGKTFCFTGKFTTIDRKDAEGLVWQNSGEVKSVSKKLTYLVNNDITSTTGKNKKAQDLGIPIISELEFLDMLK